MKKNILHILIYILLVALISTMAVLAIGFLLGWNSSIQFSDGFFGAGAILIIFGFVSFQGYGYHTGSWPPVRMETGDRAKLWAADAFRGRRLMAIFGISGLLMFGLSILVMRLF